MIVNKDRKEAGEARSYAALKPFPQERFCKKATPGIEMCFVTSRNNQQASVAEVRRLGVVVGADRRENAELGFLSDVTGKKITESIK